MNDLLVLRTSRVHKTTRISVVNPVKFSSALSQFLAVCCRSALTDNVGGVGAAFVCQSLQLQIDVLTFLVFSVCRRVARHIGECGTRRRLARISLARDHG